MDLGGVTVTWLPDIPSMSFAPDDLLAAGEGDPGPGADLDLAFGGYLITTGDLTVLVDTGVGDGKPRPRPGWDRRSSGALPAALRRAGRDLDDVDVVHLTHLHADHVGWNAVWDGSGWVPAFPRARYLAMGAELAWAEEGARRDGGFLYGSYADSILPLAGRGRIEAVGDGFRISDRIEVRAVPGHTPGSSAVIVHGERTAVLSGDLIHHPHQFAHPLTCSRFCVDRARSARRRREILDWTARRDAVLMPAHFAWGRVEAAEEGRFRFRPLPR
jgi:glyoxylase-like metal-dependent hydrolase (beta-lactamase superfamily II)